jgi:glycosyltransferase involved in cell wall biosynthesis
MIEGIQENKIHVIHNGVPMKEMVPIDQSKPAQIAMIARFERIKGHHHMLEIVKELMKVTDIPFKVVFTGDGSLKESVEKQVREANLPIEFTGHVQAIDDIYGQSQIIVNTSESEAFGFSVVEAMMLGRPVVAFNLPGLREVVNEGVTGILIPPYDCMKFAEALNSLLESPDRLERMGLAGHEWVKSNFTVQKMMNQLEALYMEEV